MKKRSHLWRRPACLVLLAIFCRASAASFNVTIPGTSDPWLAGMPPGSTASGGDTAPAQSPILVVGLSLAPGTALTFSATGSVTVFDQVPPQDPPDGSHLQSHDAGAQNGISSATMPIQCLLGVFLGPDRPDLTTAPPPRDFNTQAARDFLTLRPFLKQVFFIGDGVTSRGEIQRIVPPPGATRLFLGTMDGSGWFNNAGSFSVSITESNVPPTLSIQVADVELCWPSASNVWYRVEYRSALTTDEWVPLGGLILGTGNDICILESVRGQSRRFYRLVELP